MASHARFEVFQGEDGKFYWRFKAANNQIMAQSEAYMDKGGARTAARRIIDIIETEDVPIVNGEEDE